MRILFFKIAAWSSQIALCSIFFTACSKSAPASANWETIVERDNFDDKAPALCAVQLKGSNRRVTFFHDATTGHAVLIKLPEDVLANFQRVAESLLADCIERQPQKVAFCASLFKLENISTSELLVRIDKGPVHKTSLNHLSLYFSEKYDQEVIKEMRTGAILRYRGKVHAGVSMEGDRVKLDSYDFEKEVVLADFAGAMKASQTDCEKVNPTSK